MPYALFTTLAFSSALAFSYEGIMNIKITQITSEAFEWPRPGIWNGSHFYGPGRLHKVTVYTDQGVVGAGWNGGTAATRPQHFLREFVDFYRPLLIGRNPLETRALVRDLGEKQNKILGPAGLHTQVLAAIIIACWDIHGKLENKSVHQLLGGAKDRIRAYIAGGYYADNKGLPELQDELRYNIEELHATAVKMKIGDPDVGLNGDIDRIEAAREAIGPDNVLMVDANCACDLETATRFVEAMDEFDVFWFEEPITIHDFKGHRRLVENSRIRIATGENYYTLADFETLLDYNGAAVLNVDATICPGYDIAIDVAKIAEQKGVDIAPHGCQELQLPLAAGVSNGIFLEYYPPEVDPLRGEMFLPQLTLDKDGFVTVPDTPGIGYVLNMDLLSRYRVG
jgi:L-alanine-DL-glutamate epimerase-like enolase superfamily enzyme